MSCWRILSTTFVIAGLLQVSEVNGIRSDTGKAPLARSPDQQNASGALLEEEEFTWKPSFDPQVVGSLLTPLNDLPLQDCGSELKTIVKVNKSMAMTIRSSPELFLAQKWVGGAKRIVAVAEGWEMIDPEFKGAFPVLDGHQVVQVGSKTTSLWGNVKLLLKDLPINNMDDSSFVNFVFNAGLDLRGCWADLEDLTGRKVCSQEVIADLVSDISQTPPQMDKLGKSGSTIVKNLRGFIVKSMKNDAEYQLLKEAMPSFGKDINERFSRYGSGCYGTLLAPICATVQVPSGSDGYGDVHWLAMRKVELVDAEPYSIDLDGMDVDESDLKGPKFANTLRDGKTYFGSEEVWKHKDAGFVKMFPNPVPLRGCGSRDAAFSLELDAEMLARTQMTDYSFMGKYYKAPADEDYTCTCDSSRAPTFPLILDLVPQGKPPIRAAFGIIDYIERQVSRFDQTIGVSFSTMKGPEKYKAWWMRMWPCYFKLPERILAPASGFVAAHDHQPAEKFTVDSQVTALMKIKWNHNYRSLELNGQSLYFYHNQIFETSSEHSSRGSKYKVVAGERGTIKKLFDDGSVGVVFLRTGGSNYIFRVFPHQIRELKREVMNPLT